MKQGIPGLTGVDTTTIKGVQAGMRKVSENTASKLKQVNPRLDINHNANKQDPVLDNNGGTSKVGNVRNMFERGQMKIALQPPGGKPSAMQPPVGRHQPGYKAQVSQDSAVSVASAVSAASDSDHSGSGVIASQPPTNTRQRKQRAALPAPPSNTSSNTPQATRTASPAQAGNPGNTGGNRRRKQSAGNLQERPLPSLPSGVTNNPVSPPAKVLPPSPPQANPTSTPPRVPLHSTPTPALPARGDRPLPPTPGAQQVASPATIIPPRNPELANRPLPPPPSTDEEMVNAFFL